MKYTRSIRISCYNSRAHRNVFERLKGCTEKNALRAVLSPKVRTATVWVHTRVAENKINTVFFLKFLKIKNKTLVTF